ncbi:MAG TPA: hypothetical protein VLS89_05545, partial [Candidatus Nanopelagicales bacterium]|nr:hypothetical protein [Candidatus Nanopelagicales bacterium]
HRLAHDLPALLLRARDYPVEGGWEDILRKALGRPTARMVELFDLLEATAARADVQRARHAQQPALDASIEPEPGRFLLAIDGLEEPGKHNR